MLNKLALIGNLGGDPEMSYTPNGKAITKFSLAVSWRGKNTQGERTTDTQWFSVVAWERLAETCNQYLHKGAKVYVEGRMTSRTYTDRENVQRTVWEVTATDLEMLETKHGARHEPGDGSAEPPTGDVPF